MYNLTFPGAWELFAVYYGPLGNFHKKMVFRKIVNKTVVGRVKELNTP